MNSDEPSAAATSSARILPRRGEELLKRLTLMRQLQASLTGSREALLALDLNGIERGTREQIGLSVKLADDIAQARRKMAAKIGLGLEAISEIKLEPRQEMKSEIKARMREELRQSQLAVVQALRLQSALLVRAQWKLRVLSNMLAGPSVNYGPPIERQSELTRGWRFTGGGEI